MGPTLTSFLSRLWRTSIERPMFDKDNEVEYFCIESGVWSKCNIVKAHSDLTYDLSFPSGMVIYAVSEIYLRLVIDAVKWNERLKVGNLVEKLNNKGYWTLCKIHHVHENGHLDLMILVSKSIETGVKPHCIRIRNEKGTPTTMLKEIEMKDVKAKQESAILESALRTCCMENVSCYDGPQPVSNFIQLGCHHFFHHGCLAPALRARIEKERVKSKPRPILCPSCETAKEVVECSCCNRVPHEITEQEVVGLVHSTECDFTAQDKEHWESVTLQVFLSGGRNAVVAQPNNTRTAFALPIRERAANSFNFGFGRAAASHQHVDVAQMQHFGQQFQRQQQNRQVDHQNGEEQQQQQEEEKMITCVCGTPYFVSLRGREVNCENPKCRRTMCVQCGELAHSGVSCARAKQQMDAQLRNPLLGFEASGIFLQSCPFCGAQGDRPRECFHITCSCGGQFCFLCAAPFSPIVSHSNAYHRRECAFFEQCCARQCLEKGAPACAETASFLGPCTACKNTANHNQCTHSSNWKACRKCAVTLKINCTHWCLECAKLGRLCSPPINPIDPVTGKLQFKIISRERVVQAEAAEERKQQVQWTPLKRGAEEVFELPSEDEDLSYDGPYGEAPELVLQGVESEEDD